MTTRPPPEVPRWHCYVTFNAGRSGEKNQSFKIATATEKGALAHLERLYGNHLGIVKVALSATNEEHVPSVFLGTYYFGKKDEKDSRAPFTGIGIPYKIEYYVKLSGNWQYQGMEFAEHGNQLKMWTAVRKKALERGQGRPCRVQVYMMKLNDDGVTYSERSKFAPATYWGDQQPLPPPPASPRPRLTAPIVSSKKKEPFFWYDKDPFTRADMANVSPAPCTYKEKQKEDAQHDPTAK